MLIESEKILKAKQKLGNRNAEIISEILKVESFDSNNLKGLCPFHEENTPSFIYNTKKFNFHCFGCGRNIDIIDAYMLQGNTYIESVQKLFKEAKVKYSFGELGVQTKTLYKYPKPEYGENKENIYQYLNSRKISRETADYLNIQEDRAGNMLLQYYDTNDVLTMVKVRPSRKVNKGENKTWCLPGFDTTPLLFNLNKINSETPLLITSGELDCAAAIESGYYNSCSIPLGDQNTKWINECWDFLENFNEIIVAYDNDESGNKFIKEVVPRLGAWRCKVVNLPEQYETEDGNKYEIKDLNEYLFVAGKEKLFNLIVHAEDTPVPSVIDFSDIEDKDFSDIDGVEFGIEELDKHLMRLFYGSFTVLSGTPGCVDCNTEFFNGKEWKAISNYNENDLVLQYNEKTDEAMLTYPTSYIKEPCKSMYGFSNPSGTDQMLSDEHMVLYYDKRKNYHIDSWTNIRKFHNKHKNGFQGRFKSTFKYSGGGIKLTDSEIKIMCAAILYGSAIPYKLHEDAIYNCRIHIKDPVIKNKLRHLFEECKIKWMEKKYNNSDYTNFYIAAPYSEIEFTEQWYQCTQHQLKVVCQSICFWFKGGLKSNFYFLTSKKLTADFIQFAFSSHRKRVVVAEDYDCWKYVVKIFSKEYSKMSGGILEGKTQLYNKPTEDGYKYCFEVSSGSLVLRKNGKIFITKNSGKTSFLYQVICNAIDNEKGAWLFSRELPDWMSKNWLLYLMAGNRNLNQYQNKKGTHYWKVKPEAKSVINEYYRNKLVIYRDEYPNDVESIQTAMVDSARKYGCKLFIIDNMTTVDLKANENNKYEKQTEFVNWLIHFSMKYDVATVLVNHPRKMNAEFGNKVGIYDISGTANIINLAHRAIGLKRVTPQEKEGIPNYNGGWKVKPCSYDVIVSIIKDRLQGSQNMDIGLYYDNRSRRFYTNPFEFDKKYLWDKKVYHDELPYPIANDVDEIIGEIGE